MGFFYKHILAPIFARALNKKVYTNNPYLSLLFEAPENDLIADELFWIGLCYLSGYYLLPTDMNKALSYFKKAADKGHCVAQLFMVIYNRKHNDDCNKDNLYWLQKAAEQGEAQALFNLGISYHRGDINNKIDIAKSNELFRKSAEAGYEEAYSRMAIIYLEGEGVEKNIKIAKYWAWCDFANRSGKNRNNSILLHLLDHDDIKADNCVNYKKITEEAAEAGERDAIDFLAVISNNAGEKEKALALWLKATDLKHPKSMYNLARHYMKEGDYAHALPLLNEASKSGNELAFSGLALFYYKGLGVNKDLKKSWYYLEKALNKGDAGARYLFACICLKNEFQDFLPDNVMRGMRYMEQAASDNYQPAMEFLYKNNSKQL